MSVKRKKVFIFIFCLIIGGTSFFTINNQLAASSLPAGLIHFPVKNAVEGKSIPLEAKVEERDVQVQYMRIYFRVKGYSDYIYVEMEEQLDSYTGEIPAIVVKTPGVEYFIMALLADRTMVTSPASNPYYAPYEVNVIPQPTPKVQPEQAAPPAKEKQLISKSGAELKTVILSPEPEEHVSTDDLIIAVSFLGDTDRLDVKSIRFFIDGKDFTDKAEISRHVVSFVPKSLSLGSHKVRIELSDTTKSRFDDIVWTFDVISKEEVKKLAKLPFSGNVFAEYKSERVSDSTLTTTVFGGNIRGSYGPIAYRGRVYITSREKPDFQPRNRFLLEVGTSRIGMKLGDTSPRFNELMLWGRRVRGLEAYVKFGFFNMEFAFGETNRKIEGIPYLTVPTDSTKYIHPVTLDTVFSTTGIYRYGTYKQNLMAIRPSFGSGENFQLGFNLVKVKDDVESIQYSTQPKDNIVFGPDLLVAFDNHRVELKASAAFSLLANDITGGALSQADFDSTVGSLPFDPEKFEKYLVINASLIPLDPRGLTSLAYQTRLRLNYFNNNINIIYKSIGSEYYSLANTFLRKDIKGFSIYDRIRLYGNQIYLNLGYENYLEGLSSKDDGEVTTEPNNYVSMNVGISWYPRGKYLPKLNVNWKNYDRNNGLDTTITPTAVNYQNTDLSFQLGYDISFLGLHHYISVSHITNERLDGFNRTSSNLDNSIQMFSLKTDYQIPLTTVLTYAKNENLAGGGMYGFKYSMFGVSAIYKLLQGQLVIKGGFNSTNAVGSYTTYTDSVGNALIIPIQSNYTDYKRTVFNVGGNLKLFKRHHLLFDLSIINFDDKITGVYKNNMFRIRYQMRY